MTLFGLSLAEFWQMEIWEFTAIEKVWDQKHREELLLWRKSAYFAAAHFFDTKKATPQIEEWHPFPWDDVPDASEKWMNYDDRIELFDKVNRTHWIPQEWYNRSENFKDRISCMKSKD